MYPTDTNQKYTLSNLRLDDRYQFPLKVFVFLAIDLFIINGFFLFQLGYITALRKLSFLEDFSLGSSILDVYIVSFMKVFVIGAFIWRMTDIDGLSNCSKFMLLVIPLACVVFSAIKMILVIPHIDSVVGQLYINVAILVCSVFLPLGEFILGLIAIWKDGKSKTHYYPMDDPSSHFVSRKRGKNTTAD